MVNKSKNQRKQRKQATVVVNRPLGTASIHSANRNKLTVHRKMATKYFRGFDSWTIGPIGGEISTYGSINFTIDEFLNSTTMDRFEQYRINSLEFTFYMIGWKEDPVHVWSSFDLDAPSSSSITSVGNVVNRNNAVVSTLSRAKGEAYLGQIKSRAKLGSLVPTDSTWMSCEQDTTVHSGLVYAAIVPNGVLNYPDPNDRPTLAYWCRAHIELRGIKAE